MLSMSLNHWKKEECHWIFSGYKVNVRPCAFFSMFLVTRPRSCRLKSKKKKKLRITKSEPVYRRCHARNTCTSRLHLQTRLSGRRNFFTVIARRKKNFLLLRSWMEVDDRVNVSNHYSKKHDARHSCTLAKALKTPQRLQASELHCLVIENQKPRSFLLI